MKPRKFEKTNGAKKKDVKKLDTKRRETLVKERLGEKTWFAKKNLDTACKRRRPGGPVVA